MPIYCYKCGVCGITIERLLPCPPATLFDCPNPDCDGIAWRHQASELPAAHTKDGYHFTPKYDAGAGRTFHSQAEYSEWQRANTVDGVPPEPLEGKRKKAFLEEAGHACHINRQVEIDEKAERAALANAYDAAERELRECASMGVKPPSPHED